METGNVRFFDKLKGGRKLIAVVSAEIAIITVALIHPDYVSEAIAGVVGVVSVYVGGQSIVDRQEKKSAERRGYHESPAPDHSGPGG